jgi:hypothetical protein
VNRIGQFFTQLKHRACKAARRSVDAACVAVAEIVETVTSDECRNDSGVPDTASGDVIVL